MPVSSHVHSLPSGADAFRMPLHPYYMFMLSPLILSQVQRGLEKATMGTAPIALASLGWVKSRGRINGEGGSSSETSMRGSISERAVWPKQSYRSIGILMG